jgi:hypothetical protein
MADSTLHTLTEPDAPRPVLTPAQDFRVNVARGDLERICARDLSTATNATLLLEIGSLISSLYTVLCVLDQVAEVHR